MASATSWANWEHQAIAKRNDEVGIGNKGRRLVLSRNRRFKEASRTRPTVAAEVNLVVLRELIEISLPIQALELVPPSALQLSLGFKQTAYPVGRRELIPPNCAIRSSALRMLSPTGLQCWENVAPDTTPTMDATSGKRNAQLAIKARGSVSVAEPKPKPPPARRKKS